MPHEQGSYITIYFDLSTKMHSPRVIIIITTNNKMMSKYLAASLCFPQIHVTFRFEPHKPASNPSLIWEGNLFLLQD